MTLTRIFSVVTYLLEMGLTNVTHCENVVSYIPYCPRAHELMYKLYPQNPTLDRAIVFGTNGTTTSPPPHCPLYIDSLL